MKKKFLAGTLTVALFALMLAAVAGCGSGDSLPANVLGKVGQVQITRDQFNTELAVFKGVYTGQVPDEQTDPTAYKDFENYVLDHMITYEVVKEKAGELSISVTDQEVQDQLDQLKAKSFGGDQAKFDAALTASNMTLAQLQAYYGERMLIKKAYTEVTKNVAGPSEAEVSAYYEDNKSSYMQEETRAVRHILIVPAKPSTPTSDPASSTTTLAPTEADWAAALATAEKVRADLVAGADWKTEAAAYSNDPGSKDSGGELGTVRRNQMVPEFEQAVFSLAKDEISQPVRTVYGYHVIQVTAVSPAQQQALADVTASIQAKLLGDKQRQAWKDWLTKTKAELKAIVAEGWDYPTTTTTQPATPTSTPVTVPEQSTTTT